MWDVLRREMQINHAVTQPEVQTQIRWLVAHPSYLKQLVKSEPYIYHIVTEIRKRNLPGELALLPMIESAYNPFAYSGVGAAGLWQLMPRTGGDLGLKQDWWFDARRSIRPSTDAALNYLAYLHHYFHGDWILAMAAYDSGEGTVARSIKNSGQNPRKVNFWQLGLPRETRAYVPRLLALAEVIKNPNYYHVHLPDIAHTPYFQEVNIGSQIDLNNAAKLAGISYKDLIQLNPGYNRWATPPYKPYKLLIPTAKVARFNHNLSLLPEEKRVSLTRHKVGRGENIYSIARLYFTTPTLIHQLNRLKTDKLKTGQNILIPNAKHVPAFAKKTVSPVVNKPISYQNIKVIHIVQKGETVATLEKKYATTASKIRVWNKMEPDKNIQKGDQLVLWKTMINPGTYIVLKGDNLQSIIKKNDASLDNLLKLNPSLKNSTLKPGQRLLIG